MKRALLLFCAAALAAAASCTPGGSDEHPKVIVLGIDGGTWTMIEPMMEKGELPNLKKIYDSGLHGVLESRNPIISPVVWTTIFTGVGHAKHGIKDWKTSQSVNRRVSGIWEILRGQKMTTNVFNVPATWPPDPTGGVMLSGFPLSGASFAGNTGEVIRLEELSAGKVPVAYRDNIPVIKEAAAKLEPRQWSPWIDGTVKARPTFRGKMRVFRISNDEFYVTPLYRVDDGLVVSEPKTLRKEISDRIGEPYIPEGPGWSRWDLPLTPEYLYPHLEQVFSIQSKAALEYADKDWDLFLYVMTLTDRTSHPYWAYTHAETFPNLDPEKAKKYAYAVPDSYKRSDEEIGKILSKIKGEYYVLVVSDHGFHSNSDKNKPIGTHNPSGIYLLAGPKITPKSGTPKFIEDVTPTLLYLLNMPTGQDMDGKIFAEVVDMVGRPPASIPTWETKARDATDEPVDGDTWESLRGLGYVDGAAPRKGEKKEGEGADKPKPGPGMNARPGEVRKPGEPFKQPGAQAKPGEGEKPEGKKPGAKGDNALEDWPEAPHGEEDHAH